MYEKQVSQNYLDNERGYVKNWAHYISEHDMTLEEALEFLRGINTNRKRPLMYICYIAWLDAA